MKEVVVPKENAVFWLDKNGRWHNRHGEFEHKKIIDFFNQSIQRDENGYYLGQTHDDHVEKVYFTYEDSAIFVFDVIKDEGGVNLVLNTKRKILLDPKRLFIEGDFLYVSFNKERIKFTDQAAMKLSDLLEFREGHYLIRIQGIPYSIPELA
ncbi:MAG: MFS transporter permease [Pseudomonadota bacterium]